MYHQAIHWLFDYPEPINVALVGNLAAATLNFVVSYSMDNSSWFDQYWAMAPVPIALYYAFNENTNWAIAGSRKILALVAVTVWAVRLFSLWFYRVERENDSGGTGPCCRLQLPSLLIPILTTLFHLAGLLTTVGKLAYGAQHEDARYKEFRQKSGSWYWLVSFVVLHIAPALVLHWGCLPLYYVLSSPHPSPTSPLDWAAFIFTMGAIALEATADQQLLDFTQRKMKDRTLTICNVGLWSWSRHPNYFGEFSFWLGIYLMGLAAAGHDALWTATGAVAVLMLFLTYSIPFMEKRMKRYDEWAQYVRTTHAFIPFPTIFQRV